jgi:hypothetical protein
VARLDAPYVRRDPQRPSCGAHVHEVHRPLRRHLQHTRRLGDSRRGRPRQSTSGHESIQTARVQGGLAHDWAQRPRRVLQAARPPAVPNGREGRHVQGNKLLQLHLVTATVSLQLSYILCCTLGTFYYYIFVFHILPVVLLFCRISKEHKLSTPIPMRKRKARNKLCVSFF